MMWSQVGMNPVMRLCPQWSGGWRWWSARGPCPPFGHRPRAWPGSLHLWCSGSWQLLLTPRKGRRLSGLQWLSLRSRAFYSSLVGLLPYGRGSSSVDDRLPAGLLDVSARWQATEEEVVEGLARLPSQSSPGFSG